MCDSSPERVINDVTFFSSNCPLGLYDKTAIKSNIRVLFLLEITLTQSTAQRKCATFFAKKKMKCFPPPDNENQAHSGQAFMAALFQRA
jgi:hypothetical protein